MIILGKYSLDSIFHAHWAVKARVEMHPSASLAYETAMSLLQETLILCPTLQTQHLRLVKASAMGWTMPSDYASYQIENGQVEQAIETLERGRALIWSEMRGLRTSTDQLRAADLALAEKLADLNQEARVSDGVCRTERRRRNRSQRNWN
jgi:hypothetical protein